MKNQGFTLIEALAVIVLIGIIASVVNISYAYLNKGSSKSYYDTLEQSLQMAASDYFYYEKDNNSKVYLKDLKNYLNSEIKDMNNNSCNLEKSYVAYTLTNQRKDYYVCLICDDYQSADERCEKD